MTLEWRGEDAFDEFGTRVASVARFRDTFGDGYVSEWFWNVFVAHEYVLVDGVPGRWLTADEAREAATQVYGLLRERSEGRPVLPPSDTVEPLPWQERLGSWLRLVRLLR